MTPLDCRRELYVHWKKNGTARGRGWSESIICKVFFRHDFISKADLANYGTIVVLPRLELVIVIGIDIIVCGLVSVNIIHDQKFSITKGKLEIRMRVRWEYAGT